MVLLASTAAPPTVQDIPIAAAGASALFVDSGFDPYQGSTLSATSYGLLEARAEIEQEEGDFGTPLMCA